MEKCCNFHKICSKIANNVIAESAQSSHNLTDLKKHIFV